MFVIDGSGIDLRLLHDPAAGHKWYFGRLLL
jgi:hypothetical protein